MRAALLALGLVGCSSAAVEVGERLPAGDVEGFDRLTRLEGALPGALAPGDGRGCNRVPGGTVARDLDGDGAIDLAFARADAPPLLLWNRDGAFVEHDWSDAATDGLAALDRAWLSILAADLDGDDAPDLVLGGDGIVVALPGGAGDFGAPRVLWEQPGWPRACIQTLAAGDVDGDGDLDLAAPGLDAVPHEGFVPDRPIPLDGTEDRLLINDGDAWTAEAIPRDDPWLSFLAHFTDRDGDGDLDLILGTDRPDGGRSAQALMDNDGGSLTDITEASTAVVYPSAMGLDSRDWNRDGWMDWCVTDVAEQLTCLVSNPETHSYVMTGEAQGLRAAPAELPGWDGGPWVAWALNFVDLDADGWLDGATVAGRTPDSGSVDNSHAPVGQPDVLWRGVEGEVFEAWTEPSFGSSDDHYGLAAADLFGDGYPDLVIGPGRGAPELWDNPAGPGHRAVVRLEGAPGEGEPFGAQVWIQAGAKEERQELRSVAGTTQGPLELYFGLGSATRINRLEVLWPGGTTTVAQGLPADRLLVVRHPDAVR